MRVVYHWWSDNPNKPECNLSQPVILSIATLRAYSDVPVTILDASICDINWGEYPSLLNFTVNKSSLYLEKYKHLVPGYAQLSRIYDIKRYADQCPKLMYVDSDVFFLRNPFPTVHTGNKFSWDGWNTGLFYCDWSSTLVHEFYEFFDHLTISAIYSESIRKVCKKSINYDAWYGVWDEMILGHMRDEKPDLFDFIPPQEHSRLDKLTNQSAAFHVNGISIPNPLSGDQYCRGLTCLIFTEFFNSISQVLGNHRLKDIFGHELWKYNKFQKSIFTEIPKLISTQDENGLFSIRLPHLGLMF